MSIRPAAAAVVAISLASAWPARAVAGSVPTPTLGKAWAPYQQGYGKVRPQRIFNGGDPTGLVKNVKWLSWGTARATGVGTGWWPSKTGVVNGHWVTVEIVAWDLGRCRGTYAYRRLEWFRTEDRFDPRHAQDICTDLRKRP